jgi:hypothetical protein
MFIEEIMSACVKCGQLIESENLKNCQRCGEPIDDNVEMNTVQLDSNVSDKGASGNDKLYYDSSDTAKFFDTNINYIISNNIIEIEVSDDLTLSLFDRFQMLFDASNALKPFFDNTNYYSQYALRNYLK